MLAHSGLRGRPATTGMEIECNLVDADYQPAMSETAMLHSSPTRYQTELALEFNVPPRPLPTHFCLELEDEVSRQPRRCRDQGASCNTRCQSYLTDLLDERISARCGSTSRDRASAGPLTKTLNPDPSP